MEEEEQEEIKLVLDMAPDGPTFAMLESIMMAASEAAAATNGIKKDGGGGKAKKAYDQLTKLLKSDIPGM